MPQKAWWSMTSLRPDSMYVELPTYPVGINFLAITFMHKFA
jgi:hypothetical protein